MDTSNRVTSVPRADLPPGRWDRFVADDPQGWWFHTERFIDYALAYAPGSRDGSQAFVMDNRYLVALFPGVLVAGDAPSYGGQPFAAPLVSQSISLESLIGGHPELQVAWRPGDNRPRSVAPGFAQSVKSTRVIDLRQDEAVLWRELRKSYHSLIHKAERAYAIDLYGGGDDDKAGWRMIRAHEIHALSAGRETRPQATWDCQRAWLRDGFAMLALAQDGTNHRAFAYVVKWKNWAYYFSGAALDQSVQHALIWHLMKTLRLNGETQYLELGHDWGANATEKDRQINFFLDGFGGSAWTVDMVAKEAVCAPSP